MFCIFYKKLFSLKSKRPFTTLTLYFQSQLQRAHRRKINQRLNYSSFYYECLILVYCVCYIIFGTTQTSVGGVSRSRLKVKSLRAKEMRKYQNVPLESPIKVRSEYECRVRRHGVLLHNPLRSAHFIHIRWMELYKAKQKSTKTMCCSKWSETDREEGDL